MKRFALILTALMLVMIVGCSTNSTRLAAQTTGEVDHILVSDLLSPATQPADAVDTGYEYQPGGGFFPSALAVRNAALARESIQQSERPNVRKRGRFSASVGYTRAVGGSGYAGRNGYAGRGR